MGFPLSTFQNLAALCNDDQNVRDNFSRYKAVAVVVHDPDDRDFRRTMKYSFERLHETTGPDFAFITFIDPPLNWKRAHQDWMEVRERLSAGEGCDDRSFFRALQDRLDLPDSPCLVVTDDLLSANFLVLPTSEERFVDQLEAIGQFAQAQEHRFPADDPEFNSFLETLGSVWSAQTSDGRTLAENIADLVAVPALTGKGAFQDRMSIECQRREAENHVRRALRAHKRELELARSSEDLNGVAAEEKALRRLTDYMAIIAKTAGTDSLVHPYRPVSHARDIEWDSETDVFTIPRINCRGMESFSKDCLTNYNRLLPLYFEPEKIWMQSPVDLYHLTGGAILTDYSPLGNLLGRAVEEEVNASLVQQLRRMLGVSMPEFYRLWQKDLDVCSSPLFRNNGKLTKFNERGKPVGSDVFADRTVSMGDTVYATRYMRDRCEQGPVLGLMGEEEYLNDLYWFARGRNEACHNSQFGREEFQDIHRRFLGIIHSYLPRMASLKRRLRSRQG
jgi:hypothetical protein